MPQIQLFDSYFNRQWRLFARRTFDHNQPDHNAINLSEPHSIIQLNSLILSHCYQLNLYL